MADPGPMPWVLCRAGRCRARRAHSPKGARRRRPSPSKNGRCNRSRLRRPMAGRRAFPAAVAVALSSHSAHPPWGNRAVLTLRSGVNCGLGAPPTSCQPAARPSPTPSRPQALQSPTLSQPPLAVRLNNVAIPKPETRRAVLPSVMGFTFCALTSSPARSCRENAQPRAAPFCRSSPVLSG